MSKKIAGLAVLAGVGLLALVGCGGEEGDDPGQTSTFTYVDASKYDLAIWAPADYNGATNTLNKLIQDFKDSDPKYANLNIGVSGTIAEGNVGSELEKNAAAAADILFMADDNLRTAAEAGAILPLGEDDKAAVLAQSGEAGLESVTLDVYVDNPAQGEEHLQNNSWGFPYRNDNGYVLIYDDTKISADEAKSIEGILAACRREKVDFFYNIQDSWYTPSFLWANDGFFRPSMDQNGVITLASNFDSDGVAAAAQALSDLYKEYGVTVAGTTGGFVADNAQSTVENGFYNGTAGAVIIWNDLASIQDNVEAHAEATADTANPDTRTAANIHATALPTLKVGGQDKALNTFLGYKAVAVNSRVITEYETLDRYNLAFEFARFITSESSQKKFLEDKGYGPADTSLNQSADVANNEFLAALNDMVASGDTVPQGANVTQAFWDPIKAFGMQIVNNAKTANQWGTYRNAKEAIQQIIFTEGWESVTE